MEILRVCVILVALLALFTPHCSAHTCTGGVTNDWSSQYCDQNCGETQQCLCTGETADHNNTYNRCVQRCTNQTPNTTNVTQCMDMKCANIDECGQHCNLGVCSMDCNARKRCNQECARDGKVCPKVLCSALECHQECYNCTMECTKDVKTCYQTCMGGVCYGKCEAASCNRKCYEGNQPGTPCTIVSIGGSPINLPSFLLVSVVFVMSLLANV